MGIVKDWTRKDLAIYCISTKSNINKSNNDRIAIKRTSLGAANKKVLSTLCKTKISKVDEIVEHSCEVECDKRVQDFPEVPEGIANIDVSEENCRNPALCAEYTPFLYSYLRQMEHKLAIRKDFMQG